MDKRHWPSEQKIEKLKGEGIIPSFFMAGRLLILVLGISAAVFSAPVIFSNLTSSNFINLDKLIDMMIYITCGVIISYLIIGGIFNRFLFNPTMCRFDIRKVLSFNFRYNFIDVFFASILLPVLGFGIYFYLIYFGINTYSDLQIDSYFWRLDKNFEYLDAILRIMISCLVVGLLAVFGISKLRFLYSHRMTEAEVRADTDERVRIE